MARELHSSTLTIDQMADLVGDDAIKDRENIVFAERLPNQDYLDELAFNEEPVTIRLEPSAEKNASGWYPVWVNGKGAEVFQNGKWIEYGYLPVGRNIVVKRKYVEVIIRAKLDTVTTDVLNRESEHPDNVVRRFTSAVHSFSILHDANPLGAAWVTELRRRYM